ncbi:SHOCT domain-containing protein [Caballeronia sp. RCC_10]|uniref:SHOCT domain-containing protein n=1 Tax=Caballeronia sp. RCC_10 TaxID=3239227 RepID=UPI0035233BC2
MEALNRTDGKRMKYLVLAGLVAALGGCVSAPELDLTNVDHACSQRCSSEYSRCTTGFKLFPLVEQAHCNESLKVCVSTCGPSQPVSASASSSQKLTELSELYKRGLINQKEFDAKKQDILKAL